jgi:urease accessory protein UreE
MCRIDLSEHIQVLQRLEENSLLNDGTVVEYNERYCRWLNRLATEQQLVVADSWRAMGVCSAADGPDEAVRHNVMS